MELLAANDSYRYNEVTEDLICIENVYPSEYDFKVPTLVPLTWKSYIHITQDIYNSRFIVNNELMYNMLNSIDNVVIAGGSAARPLYVNNRSMFIDNDIFIYGISDEELFWKKINEIASYIINESIKIDPSCDATQKIKKGILIINVYSRRSELYQEYQIILRMYHSVSSVIHAFDIPSCCIAFDGKTTYTTTLGAYAHANQVNLVSTKYRSTTFELRLIKYFKRGFALGMVGYNVEKAFDDESNTLSHNYMSIECESVDKNHIIVSNIYSKHRVMRGDEEYASIKLPFMKSFQDFITYAQCIEDVGVVLTTQTKDIIDYTYFYNREVHEIIKQHPSITGGILKRHASNIIKMSIIYLQNIPLSKQVLLDILTIILDNKHNNRKQVDLISVILMEHVTFSTRYVPEWIICHEPGRQYTASINPIIEDPEQWYGSGLYTA